MIARHIPMTSAAKSSFARLVRYNTNPQGKDERVGAVSVTNCHSGQAEIAVLEVLNTQAQNTRSAADKTYHLLVSFPPGESPSAAILGAIEERLCAAIGFAGHQRISVVHHDTDSLHVHIAINKIHPRRYTIHEPYNAYHALGLICDKLEKEYGLQRVNHTARKVKSENRAADMERHADVESLLGWIKRECQHHIQHAQSWNDMHEVMRAHGLTMHERANGLVITAESGVSVKASSVGREFSKARLEERLGSFHTPGGPVTDRMASKRYDKKPMRSRVNTVELHARYKLAQVEAASTRAIEWAKAAARKNRLIEAAKRRGRLKHAAIKLVQAPGVKIMYAATSKALREDIAAINKQYRKERQEIYEKYRRRAWVDWLRSEAMAGDKEALEALRAREISTGLGGNTVGGSRAPAGTAGAGPRHDNITKKGTIIYRVGASAVRDDGHKLKVSRGVDQAGLQAALRMAMERYGSCLAVNGTAAFKEQIVRAAVAANLSVSFDDAALERRRRQLIRPPTPKENKHAHEGRNDKRIVGRQPDRNRHGGAARAAAAATRAGANLPTRYAKGDKSRAGGAGSKSPPEIRNGMRRLSELGVVHVAHRSEMLLPGHVSDHVERQGAQPDHGLRRDVRGPGRLNAAAAVQPEQSHKPKGGRGRIAPPPASKGGQRSLASLNATAVGGTHGATAPPILAQQTPLSTGRETPATRPACTATRPKVGRAGLAPPPASQYRLRHLSQLGAVVNGERRPELAPPTPAPAQPGPAGREAVAARATCAGTKPTIGRVGMAPPASRHRRRRLSQLGTVVGVSGGDAAPDVPARRHQAPSNHEGGAPRDSVPPEAKTAGIAAAEKYIIEREQKRRIGFDIPKHKRYTLTNDEAAHYAGMRVIDGQALALLKVGDEVMVLPVDAATARRLKRVSLGRQVEVSAQGAIKTKGRSR